MQKKRPPIRPPPIFFICLWQILAMLNVSFVLKDKGTNSKSISPKKEKITDKETPIICYLRYNAQRLKYYTGEKIFPRHWDDRKKSKKYQRAKSSLIEAPELNARLDKIATTAKNVFRKYQNEKNNQIPDTETLKALLDKEFNRTKETASLTAKTFIPFLEEIIKLSKGGVRRNAKTGKPISKNTIKTYNTVLNHLLAFQPKFEKRNKKKIDFDIIDIDFYNSYIEFLMKGERFNAKTGKMVPLNLSTNAISKDIQIIKLIMAEATDKGLNTNRAFESSRFAVIRENSDSIYLPESEINEMEQLNLSEKKNLEKVRDQFLTGYYTGQRFSDYSIIDTDKITKDEDGDEFLEITQVKTGNIIQLPVHPNLKNIINKYGGKLPRTYSNQKTNEYLKEIGKLMPSLQKKIPINRPTKDGMRVNELCPKFELLTTHTARRSFATNHYLAGWQILTIMNITGHKTTKAFMSYIKLTTKEHAKVAHTEWKKKKAILKAI